MAMTARVPGSSTASISTAVPRTQNTAPVLEFRCLFTKDLRQKQKRWQDGRLKYHTFNKRVMVYDERSNFVGDTHWREDSEFDDGEDLELDRSGVLVQVGEFIGKKDQDLTELVDKRLKEKEERFAARTAAASPARSALLNRSQVTATPAGTHIRPKPLNSVIGTPTGHYGRAAIPTTTPFEERQRLIGGGGGGDENDRPTKRRKQDISPPSKSGYAQNLFGAAVTLSRPPGSATSRYVTARTSIQRSQVGSIDRTGEPDADRRRPEMPTQGAREERSFEKGSATSRVQNKGPSLPPRSSYASNLTGTALSLSGPQELRSSRVKKVPNLKVGIREPSNDPARASSPSSNSEDDVVEIMATEDQPTVVAAKHKKLRRNVEASVNSTSSSSPSRAVKRPILTSRSSSTTSNTPIFKPSMPQSALRIKTREPKRMMMLMDRPSSRTISPKKPSLHSQSASKYMTAPAPQEPVPSQATARLNSMLKKNEERLEARLAGHRPAVDVVELPSSPIEDSGIDHKTVGILLTRRTITNSRESARGVPTTSGLRQGRDLASVSSCPAKEDRNIGAKPVSDTEAGTSSSSSSLRPHAIPFMTELSQDDLVVTRSIQDIPDVPNTVSYSTATGLQSKTPIVKNMFSQTSVEWKSLGLLSAEDEHVMLASAQAEEAGSDLATLRKEMEAAQRKSIEEEQKLASLKDEREIIEKKASEERQRKAIEEEEKLARIKEEMEMIQKRVIEERQELARVELARLERIEKERIARGEAERARVEREKLESERRERERLEKERLEKEAAAVQQQKLERERKAEEDRQKVARLEQERMIREAVRQERERIEEEQRLRDEEEEKTRAMLAAIAAEELIKSRGNTERPNAQNLSSMNIPVAQKTRRTVNSTTAGIVTSSRLGPTFPAHFGHALSSATDRFRRMINAPPPHADSTEQLGIVAEAAPPSISPKVEPYPSDVGITRFYEPQPHYPKNSNGGATPANMDAIPDAPQYAVAAMTSGVTKAFKLSRPATRGETGGKVPENIVTTAMPPPQRIERNAGAIDGAKMSARYGVAKAAASGPWSREAFDLFSWRPPS